MSLLQWFVLVALCLWLYVLWTRRQYYMLVLKVPGPLGYPIIGMAHKLMKREEILNTFDVNMRKYGPVFFSWLGTFPFLIVAEPQIVQDILTSPHCVNKGFIYNALDDGTGRGLFSLKNPEWSVHRKLLNPAFGHRVLLSFMPIFNEEVNELLKTLNSISDTNAVDITKIIQKFTLNIATRVETTMGRNFSQVENSENHNLLSYYQCVQETMTQMCFSPWLNNRFVHWLLGARVPYVRAKMEIRNFIRNLIREKLTNGLDDISMQEKKEKNVFINLAINLMKSGDFTWQNVEDESNVIVFGAFETTANTVAYTLILLAMFPSYQQKAFEEISTVFPDRDNVDVTYSDAQQMVYMDMILNETMRVITPVPIISRQTSESVRLSNGVTIPKGVQIAIDIFHMHRREDIWGSQAHLFNPENFLPSNLEGKHSFAFIPFTKGIRNCIGWRYALLSIKVTLIKLIRNYRFSTKFNFDKLDFVEDITIKLKKMPLLEIRRREC